MYKGPEWIEENGVRYERRPAPASKVKGYLVLAALTVAAALSAAIGFQVYQTIREFRQIQKKTAPAIEQTAANVQKITAMLANCDDSPDTCAGKTAQAIQEAAGSMKATAAALQQTAEAGSKAAEALSRGIEQGSPQALKVINAAAEFATLLGDCKAAPKTCLQPRLAGMMRAAELAAGNTYKVTREAARVAPETADATRDTLKHAETISKAAAAHAEPIAEHVESLTKDAATIAHRAANPITYVLGLIHTALKKFFPFIP